MKVLPQRAAGSAFSPPADLARPARLLRAQAELRRLHAGPVLPVGGSRSLSGAATASIAGSPRSRRPTSRERWASRCSRRRAAPTPGSSSCPTGPVTLLHLDLDLVGEVRAHAERERRAARDTDVAAAIAGVDLADLVQELDDVAARQHGKRLAEARHVLPVDRRDRPEQARDLLRRARRRAVRIKRVRLSAPRDAAFDHRPEPRAAQQRAATVR